MSSYKFCTAPDSFSKAQYSQNLSRSPYSQRPLFVAYLPPWRCRKQSFEITEELSLCACMPLFKLLNKIMDKCKVISVWDIQQPIIKSLGTRKLVRREAPMQDFEFFSGQLQSGISARALNTLCKQTLFNLGENMSFFCMAAAMIWGNRKPVGAHFSARAVTSC
jgi:hypothetical protein